MSGPVTGPGEELTGPEESGAMTERERVFLASRRPAAPGAAEAPEQGPGASGTPDFTQGVVGVALGVSALNLLGRQLNTAGADNRVARHRGELQAALSHRLGFNPEELETRRAWETVELDLLKHWSAATVRGNWRQQLQEADIEALESSVQELIEFAPAYTDDPLGRVRSVAGPLLAYAEGARVVQGRPPGRLVRHSTLRTAHGACLNLLAMLGVNWARSDAGAHCLGNLVARAPYPGLPHLDHLPEHRGWRAEVMATAEQVDRAIASLSGEELRGGALRRPEGQSTQRAVAQVLGRRMRSGAWQ